MPSPSGSAGQSQSPKPDPEKHDSLPIKKIGKYEIQKKIGAGGMGAVYLAVDPFLKRSCALKVLPQEKAKNPTLVKRFRSEAQQAATLRHENIVSIYEAGEADGYSYIALEYVEGTDVSNLVRKRGVIPLRRSIEIIRQVAQALDHAHEKGIVHRDIKPGNLLVRQDGVVKLADMGLARSLDDVETAITRAGTTVGTVDYMSPEQARDSKAADVRSDIYSLGCTWYFMLTGEAPFRDGTLTQKLRAHAETPLPDPRQENASVTEAVFTVLRRMTEKKASSRYQTPKELLSDLDVENLTSNIVASSILGDSWEADGEPIPDSPTVEASTEDLASSKRKKVSKKKSRPTDDDDDFDSSESDEKPSRRAEKPPRVKSARDDDAGFKPPPRRDPAEKQKILADVEQAKGRTALFYTVVGSAGVAVIAGVVWLIIQFSSASSNSDSISNPFAKNVNGGSSGNSNVVAGGTIGGENTAIGGGATDGGIANAGTNLGGDTAGGVNLGSGGTLPGGVSMTQAPPTTRIGSEPEGGVEVGADPSGNAGNANVGGTSSAGSPAVGGSAANGGGSNTNIGGGANSGAPATANNAGGGKTNNLGGNATGTPSAGNASNSSNTSVGKTGNVAGGQGTGKANANNAANQQAAAARESRILKELKHLPVWAQQDRPTEGLPVLVVQPGSVGNDVYPTLNKALEKVTEKGACIKLMGRGPFPLNPIQLVDKRRIVIEPRNDVSVADQPVVVLLFPVESPARIVLGARNTNFDLRRLHIVFDAADQKTTVDDALISVDSADLFMQQCSLTVQGMAQFPISIAAVSGKTARPDANGGNLPRVLFDQTLLRANNATALKVLGENLDCIARGSLFWSGKAPAVKFETVARSDADSQRSIRAVSTSLCSQVAAVQLTGDAANPVPINLEFINSIVAAPTGGDDAVLFNLVGWTKAQQKSAVGKFMNWKTLGTQFAGWKTLIRTSTKDETEVEGAENWPAVWKEKDVTLEAQFASDHWPQQNVTDVSRMSLDLFRLQSLGKNSVKTDDGDLPGCTPERLAIGDLNLSATARVASLRPQIPPGMFNLPIKDVLQIDVTKQDLGKVLESKRLTTGMTIKVSGSGLRTSSPIVIEGVWVRMQFEQTEGAPLVITPRSGDSKSEAFITIRNGGVEMERAVFSVPTAEKSLIPKWMVHVVDGDLGLYRCRIHGPVNAPSRNEGLIRWEWNTGRAPARPFEASFDGYQIIQSSFLVGSGKLIDADMRRRAIIVHNSVLVSRDVLAALNLDGTDPHIDGAVDIRYSTFSAVDRIWSVRGGNLAAPAETPLMMYAERSVFGPPLRAPAQKARPTVFGYTGKTLEQMQVSWWEDHCGYSPEIVTFVQAEKAETATQKLDEQWIGLWGAEHVLQPLFGTGGVVLKKELPTKPDERSRIEPDDFELMPGCRAMTWEGGKLPIGAYIGTMQLPPIRNSAASAAEKKDKKKTPRQDYDSGATQPGF